MPVVRTIRIVAASALAAALVFASASVAAAHVTVSSPDASPGGFGKIVFRVPTESETASTVAVSVTLPSDTPFAFVSSKTKPGWTVERTTTKLDEPLEVEGFTISEAVTEITWTADGAGVGPGEFDEFEASVGPFPSGVESIVLPVVQTYDDGTEVSWDQPPNADGSEPEHPAPELSLTGETADHHGDDEAEQESAEHSDDDAGDESDSAEDNTARALGVGGLVLGGVGLLAAAVALRMNRSSRPS